MSSLTLKKNHPFDVSYLRQLSISQEDLRLVRPDASFPIKDEEWTSLFAKETYVSFLVYSNDELIGHFGLVENPERRYCIVFVYLSPTHRSGGLAFELMKRAEEYARHEFGANEIFLNVQESNPRAIALYKKCGFTEVFQKGTTIRMEKK